MKNKNVQFTEDQLKWLNKEKEVSGYSANTIIRMAVDNYKKKVEGEREKNG